VTPLLFGLTAVPLIGLYDGVFGPGAGSFYMLAFVLLAGFGMLKATAHTKLLNLGSNFGSFLVFALTGSILWKVGAGHGRGAGSGVRRSDHGSPCAAARKSSSPLLVLSCLGLALKLISDPAHPLRVWVGV
jgi:uncharacterized membrane protein YfcA